MQFGRSMQQSAGVRGKIHDSVLTQIMMVGILNKG